jgi:biopolymer transport protein TolR
VTTRSRRGGRRARGLPVNAEINVTSLIDVAFTLLVIFIITAPMLQGGIEVRLPQAQVQPITAQDDPFIVSMDADGTVYIGETPVSLEEFESAFPQLFEAARPGALYIRGDGRVMLDQFLPVATIMFNAAREAGISVSLLAEPEPRR